MNKWKDVLHAPTIVLNFRTLIQTALQSLSENKVEIALVSDQTSIIGYIDSMSLLEQIRAGASLQDEIQYHNNLLQVPQENQIELYHNISAFLGVDSNNQPSGFCTVEEARHRINQLELNHLNQVVNSAGVGIITTNTSYEVTSINETAEEILGLQSKVILNRNYRVLINADVNFDEILSGRQFINVKSAFNRKELIGNFSPLRFNKSITGIVHVFFLKERWEENIREVEFVRDLEDDLQAIYSSSNEQLLVSDSDGKIIRLAGTFLHRFWMKDRREDIIGQTASVLEREGIFQPNIIQQCINQKTKTTGVQETRNGQRIWSVATPVFRNESLEKVIVVSRDISGLEFFRGLDDVEEPQREPARPLIYRSSKMKQIVDQLRRISKVGSTVLLTGESGVGKEVFAHAIHDFSRRSQQPFVRINCGAISESLIESELFGYEKGAFTGANQGGKAGLFEVANHGTLFLDEITELPLPAQVKLLRVLQEKEFTRVGGIKPIHINVRIIAATNQNLKNLVSEKKFREDLYYRLNVIPINIPPLRKRVDDIAPLAIHFLDHFQVLYEQNKTLSMAALEVLEAYHWPGNVRELQNVIERLLVTSGNSAIGADEVLFVLYGNSEEDQIKPIVPALIPLKDAVSEVEKQLIEMGLRKYGNAAHVSEILGISQATISRKINKLLK